jgi:hypothetical protein
LVRALALDGCVGEVPVPVDDFAGADMPTACQAESLESPRATVDVRLAVAASTIDPDGLCLDRSDHLADRAESRSLRTFASSSISSSRRRPKSTRWGQYGVTTEYYQRRRTPLPHDHAGGALRLAVAVGLIGSSCMASTEVDEVGLTWAYVLPSRVMHCTVCGFSGLESGEQRRPLQRLRQFEVMNR